MSASLESPPAGIRRHLLSVVEYEGLKALTHACPVYHQEYLLDRKWIPFKYLDRTLRSAIIEVGAVCRSGSIDFFETRSYDSVSMYRTARYHTIQFSTKT